jgi:HEAT repeat protein
MNALARRGDPESMRALSDAASGKDENLRSEALSALGSSGRSEAGPILEAAVREADPKVRSSALNALALLGGPAAERAIAVTATSPDASSRLLAVEVLAQRSVPNATTTLENLTHDRESEVAQGALRALARTAPDRALPLVEDAMRSEDRAARLSALTVAGSLDEEPKSRILVAGIHDPDPVVVQSAARQLAYLGGPAAQSALVDLLTGSFAPDSTKKLAADALSQMGGDAAERFRDLIAKFSAVPADESGEGEDEER